MDKLDYGYAVAKFVIDKETTELILFVKMDDERFQGRKNLVFKVDRNFCDEDIPQEKLDVRMGTDLEARLLEKFTDNRLINHTVPTNYIESI